MTTCRVPNALLYTEYLVHIPILIIKQPITSCENKYLLFGNTQLFIIRIRPCLDSLLHWNFVWIHHFLFKSVFIYPFFFVAVRFGKYIFQLISSLIQLLHKIILKQVSSGAYREEMIYFLFFGFWKNYPVFVVSIDNYIFRLV